MVAKRDTKTVANLYSAINTYCGVRVKGKGRATIIKLLR